MKEKKNTYTLVPPPINHKGRVFLLFILTLILSSCKYWHEPVREYLEKWTKEVSIEKFEVEDVESYYDKDGNLCIPSGQDATLTLFLINPFHYDYNGYYHDKIPQCPISGMTIWPDANDTTLLHLTYDRDFLAAHDGKPDGGSEIGTTINYEHPVNTTPKSYTFSLKCNSRPPVIDDGAIMYRTVSGQDYYVLAFNCPDPTLCSSTEIHRDIVAVNINGVSYSVQLDSSGNMSFSDTDIFARGIRSDLHVLNRDFNETERSVYFITSDPVINGVDKSFTISFVDSAGLENSTTLNTSVPSVAAPTVKDNDDDDLSTDGVNTLHTDSGKTYSTLTIEPPTSDAAGNILGEPKPTVKFELYNADDVYALGGKIDSPTTTGPDDNGNVTLQIPNNGHYILRVHAEKEGYTKSATIEYRLNLEYATLKVPVVKNVTNGASEVLSPTAANNYIELKKSNDEYYINVRFDAPTETTAGEYVDLNIGSDKATTIYYAITQGKTIREDLNYETNSGGVFLKPFEGFGQYCLTVYATKPGYKDSEHVSYLIKTHNDTLYVAGDGNDTKNDGSQLNPYATIQHAVNELAAYNNASKTYTINVSGQVNGNQTVSDDLNNKAAKLIITGVGDSDTLMGSGTGSVLSIMTSVPVEISSLGITGGNAGNSGKGGGLYANAGSNITLKTGAKIYGNSANRGGGLYIKSGATVTLAGATIGGSAQDKNTGIGNFSFGGGIYNEGTLNISSGTISYNTTTSDDSYGGGISNDGTL
ncbi:MAG: hypothetical protein J6S91_13625, partial [Treponema sp.]|nr:hypothetical protein [Treponema sp.]